MALQNLFALLMHKDNLIMAISSGAWKNSGSFVPYFWQILVLTIFLMHFSLLNSNLAVLVYYQRKMPPKIPGRLSVFFCVQPYNNNAHFKSESHQNCFTFETEVNLTSKRSRLNLQKSPNLKLTIRRPINIHSNILSTSEGTAATYLAFKVVTNKTFQNFGH